MATTMSSFPIFCTNRILAIVFLSLFGIIWYKFRPISSPISTKISLPISDPFLKNQRLDSSVLPIPDKSLLLTKEVVFVKQTVDNKLLDDVEQIQSQEDVETLPAEVQMTQFKIPNRSEFVIAEDEFQKNRTCKIPYIFPYEEETLDILKQDVEGVKNPHCLVNPTEKFTSDQNTKILRKNPNDNFWKENSCCYVPFVGINKNYKNLTECIDIIDNVTTIPNVFENIQVVCFHTETRNLTYRDYFHFLRLNATTEKVLDEKRKKSDDYHPSVIILGLDTVSFTNFQRFLPKTRKYILETLEAIEFSGMNKVGLGTTENMIPMISNCGYDSVGTIFPGPDQDCTQIWERYEEKGYRTLQSLEEYWVLVNELMKRNQHGQHNMTYSNLEFVQGIQRTAPPALEQYGCYEHKWAFNIISDRLLQAARKLRGKPYFHLLWSPLESHQIIAMSQLLDNPLLRVLKLLIAENLLEDTILLLLSDHGMVSAYYAQTSDGRVEANQPFLYVVLPKRIKRKYTVAVSNMKRNSKGLVTPYDIHQTLLSILNLSSVTNRKLKSPSVTNRKQKSVYGSKQVSRSESEQTGNGISLFRPIPLNRTCDDAHIPKQYCLCWYWTKVQDFQKDRTVLEGANFTVGYINQNLEAYPDCLPLTLKSIEGAEHTSDAFGNVFLRISFSTSPNKAKFQVIVTFKTSGPERDSTFELVGDVERKNKYGKQSSCLTEEMQLVGWIRSVCLCKSYSFD